ncbi:MAG: YgiT-type zinc finger protein [Candidatus Hydrogenedentes bacterium]|nr:YgiT-type zinc finger protein [Candidatus Hydrogenedentota bacterium]
MQCATCDGETKTKLVTRQHWFDQRLYIVEHVIANVCTNCGERYFDAETLDQIDAFLQSDHEVKRKLSVEVVSLP